MLLSLFIFIPLIIGIIYFILNEQKAQVFLGLAVSVVMLGLTFYFYKSAEELTYSFYWFSFNNVKSYFYISFTEISRLMILLTNLIFFILFLYLIASHQKYSNSFYALLMFTMAGLNGVFLARDLILFYLFWEIVLIPIYFLIGIWGKGDDKINANTTFFLYTIFGSMLMLGGILYIGFSLKPQNFLLESIQPIVSNYSNLSFLGILFLIAFIIKIPIFPFHSWQPVIYKVSPTPVTVILSALMAKMGLFAIIQWYIPLFSTSIHFLNILYMAGIGIIYASLIAMTTNNIKKLIAYSSIAHLALIFISLYGNEYYGIHGAYFQMFSHGIVVAGLWICVDIMERKYEVDNIQSIGGLASINPTLSIFFMLFCLANLSLPLTSNFIGEFSMLSSLFRSNLILCIMGLSGVIFSAVYTLRMVGIILFGEPHSKIINTCNDDNNLMYFVLGVLCLTIIVLGIYPSLITNIFNFS